MDIVIGGIVPDKRNMQNTYILHTECTHSCGAHTTNRLRFDGKIRLELFWQFFRPFLDTTIDNAKDLTKLAHQTAETLNMTDDGLEVFKMVIPHDKSELGSMATLAKMWVRFWDDDGHEHFVDMNNI